MCLVGFSVVFFLCLVGCLVCCCSCACVFIFVLVGFIVMGFLFCGLRGLCWAV